MRVRGTVRGSPQFLVRVADYLDEPPLRLEPCECFDPAIVALTEHARDRWTRETPHPVFVYDTRLCIEAIARMCADDGASDDELDYEAAQDYFEFNTAGAWMGPGTPTFHDPDDDLEADPDD